MEPTQRTLFVVSLTVAMILLLGACSSGSHASSTPGRTTGSTVACAWPTRADRGTQNLAYPDTSATYWVTSYRLARGERLELRGRFPSARYMSFITYGPTGGVRDVLADRDITPTPHHSNPFTGATSTRFASNSDAYRVIVASSGAEHTNTISASGSAGSATTPAIPLPATAPIPVGSGTTGGSGVVTGSIIYRVYLATPRRDPTGGAGLPSIRVLHADGTRTAVATCARPGKNPNAESIVRANGPATDRPAPAQPIFIRPDSSASTLYPNPDNVYVATILHYQPGTVVVVRGRAPTFPDTGARHPITGQEQVRYWSLCTNEYRKPYPVTTCAPDEHVVVDGAGDYIFVISTRADRPANATAANDVTWLNWGSTKVDMLLLVRHMLANPDFAESAIRLPPGATASSTMGAYAPRGAYCSSITFARGGPAACG